ncbi:primosomal replication protein N [Castellaniella sp.]|uniref:primosomal replication protein N n=1 Tax=Castellaniella sp. TaxID=1955812 RepID=UPI002AFF8EB3|nr:primosomal replication protein N [Castellaniella sp.]
MNRVELAAKLVDIPPMRHTPAGLPVLRLQLAHESQVIEAGLARKISMEFKAIALGDIALALARYTAGSQVQVVGFLAPQRQGSDRLVLHIQQLVQVTE